jgi:hypothetical protein
MALALIDAEQQTIALESSPLEVDNRTAPPSCGRGRHK